MSFTCNVCQKKFAHKGNLARHKLLHSKQEHCFRCIRAVSDLKTHNFNFHGNFKCTECNRHFSRQLAFKKHTEKHGTYYVCDICRSSFSRKDNLKAHIFQIHASLLKCTNQLKYKSSLKKTLQEFKIKGKHQVDPSIFFKNHAEKIYFTVEDNLRRFKGIKWSLHLYVSFQKNYPSNNETIRAWFSSKVNTQIDYFSIEEAYQIATEKIEASIDGFQRMGSGWVISEIIHLLIKVCKYYPLKGRSYINLPKCLKDKRAILNIKNLDDFCFCYAILAALHPITDNSNANRVANYKPFLNELNLQNIPMPMSLESLPTFEKKNSNIAVNVFSFDQKKELKIYPVYISKKSTPEFLVNLLYISNEKQSHFCLIKDFSRLMAHLTNHHGKAYYCFRCLHRFSTTERLSNHRALCEKKSPQRVTYGCPGEVIKFKNFHYGIPSYYRMYLDFESLICVRNESAGANTIKTGEHIPCGYSMVIIGENQKFVGSPIVYRGPDAAEHFLEQALRKAENLVKKIENIKPLQMTQSDIESFESSLSCTFCKRKFSELVIKVKKYCHLTGSYQQALCQQCYLNYRKSLKINCIVHNLRAYDSHIIAKAIGKFNAKISCIGKTLENYISFTVGSIRFLDSYQFMPSSLSTLVSNLAADGIHNFVAMSQGFPNNTQTDVAMLIRKGVYPYSYIDNDDKFKDKQLPPRSAFYNDLTKENITSLDYELAHEIWKKFNITTLGQYHDLYVKTDCLLLCDVFEAFRALCLKIDDIDPVHVLTAPGLSWESCLKMTQVELEVIVDPNIFLFIENSIKGGLSVVTHHFAKANNPEVPNYNPLKPNSWIGLFDATNLYGWALSQPLPLKDFKWLKINNDRQIPEIADGHGMILEVDLDCPPEIHDKLNYFPPLYEHMQVTPEMLSPYTLKLAEQLNITLDFNTPKLIQHLMDVKKYVIHYKVLIKVLKLGLQLKKIHRALGFIETPWAKPYIEFNTEMRKNAKSDFERDFFKLKINSLFGRTLMNVRKHTNIELVNNPKRALKLCASPALKDYRIFDENLTGFNMTKVEVKLKTPVCVGFSVLELAKLRMLEFFYDFLQKKYGESLKLILSDTDSYLVYIETEDLYRDIYQHKKHFDCSVFPKDHYAYDSTNKKKVGKFKLEHCGSTIEKVCAIRSKVYSIKFVDKSPHKVAKGVNRSTLKYDFSYEDYESCLFNAKIKYGEMFSIGSKKHNLYTLRQTKMALNPTDLKRYQVDGVATLAYGHYNIAN